jgi:hypothetical protein
VPKTMSSVHKDKGWILVSFILPNGDQRTRVRLYPGIRATRDGMRSPTIKEIRKLVEMQRWAELAERFPRCKQLAPFRSTLSRPDTTTFRERPIDSLHIKGTPIRRPPSISICLF